MKTLSIADAGADEKERMKIDWGMGVPFPNKHAKLPQCLETTCVLFCTCDVSGLDPKDDVEAGKEAKEVSLPDHFERSHFNTAMRDEAGRIYSNYRDVKDNNVASIDYPTSFFSQVLLLSFLLYPEYVFNEPLFFC